MSASVELLPKFPIDPSYQLFLHCFWLAASADPYSNSETSPITNAFKKLGTASGGTNQLTTFIARRPCP